HGKERSAEVRAHVVRVPEAQLHLHVNRFHVGRNVLDTNARTQERRPEVDPATEMACALVAAEELQENVAALHSRSSFAVFIKNHGCGGTARPRPEKASRISSPPRRSR